MRKIYDFIPHGAWATIIERLSDEPGVYVGADAGGPIVRVTRYAPNGEARQHWFDISKSRIPAVTPDIDLSFDKPTVKSIISALNKKTGGPEAALRAADAIVGVARAKKDEARDRRNLAMVELHWVHGWTEKARIYELVGVQRSDLDDALETLSIADLTGYPSGQECADAAEQHNRTYWAERIIEETALALRTSLIRSYMGGWFGKPDDDDAYSAAEVGEMAGVTAARVRQLCNPGYRDQRIALRESKKVVPERRRGLYRLPTDSNYTAAGG